MCCKKSLCFCVIQREKWKGGESDCAEWNSKTNNTITNTMKVNGQNITYTYDENERLISLKKDSKDV